MTSYSKEDQKGQLMIDSRFSAQKQISAHSEQLGDYFHHLTQQVWRGAALFGLCHHTFTPVITDRECRRVG